MNPRLSESTSTRMPSYSTSESPSITLSSSAMPYCKPEHPPPATYTRSASSGLPSAVSNSRTFAAAVGVIVTKSDVSVMSSCIVTVCPFPLCQAAPLRSRIIGATSRLCSSHCYTATLYHVLYAYIVSRMSAQRCPHPRPPDRPTARPLRPLSSGTGRAVPCHGGLGHNDRRFFQSCTRAQD